MFIKYYIKILELIFFFFWKQNKIILLKINLL